MDGEGPPASERASERAALDLNPDPSALSPLEVYPVQGELALFVVVTVDIIARPLASRCRRLRRSRPLRGEPRYFCGTDQTSARDNLVFHVIL